MAAANSTPIQLYYSNTPGSVPLSTNLIIGELAINVPDGIIYYLDSTNTVNVIARTAAAAGRFPNVTFLTDGTKQYTAAAPWAVTNLSWATANTALTDAIYTQGVDAWQNSYSQIVYTAANNAGNFSNSAFDVANTNASNIINIQGVDLTQNTTIQNAYDRANGAYGYANSIILSGGSVDSVARNTANGAFDKANNAGDFANGAFGVANTNTTRATNAGNFANGAFNWANNSYDRANAAYSFANTVYSNYAYTALVNTLDIQGVDLAQNTSIQNSYDRANSAYGYANSINAAGATQNTNIQSSWDRANSAYGKANAAVANTSTITLAGSLIVPGQANVYQRLSVGTGSYQVLPNLIAQFTGTSDYYSQVNQQNLSANGTGDFVITADNGSDTVNYADMGMAGSTYDNTTPNAFSFVQPNDGYFMIVGNTAQNYGGNLYIGTTGSGSFSDIVFVQGNNNDQVLRFKTGGDIQFYRPVVANSFTTTSGINVVTYTDTANTYLKGLIDTKVSKSGDTINGTLTISNAASANALLVTGNVNISQDLRVSGNLYLGGNATTISSNNLTLNDSLIYLADNNPSDIVDIGFVGAFTSGVYQHTGFARDHTDGKWKVFSNVIAEPGTTIDFANAVYDIIKVGGVDAVSNVSINGIDVLSYANGIYSTTNSLVYVANTKVSSVSGSSGRITSSGGTTPTIDLATTSASPGTYLYPQIQVDAYGRVISISSQTPVTTFNSRNGSVTLLSADVTNALGYTPVDTTTYNSDKGVFQSIDVSQNTNIATVGSFANGAFLEANTAAGWANSAFVTANSAGSFANGAFAQANAVAGWANSGFITANSSGVFSNSAFDRANSAAGWANAAFITANSAGVFANAAFITANSAGSFANGSFDKANAVGNFANSAYSQANNASDFANGAFVTANSAGSIANGAFAFANTVSSTLTLEQSYSNSAFTKANSVGNFANGAFGVANSAASTSTLAYAKANTAIDNQGGVFYTDIAGGTIPEFRADNNMAIRTNGTLVLETDSGLSSGVQIKPYGTGGLGYFDFTNGGLIFPDGSVQTTAYLSSSYDKANGASNFANGAFTQANSAYTYATNAGNFANGAFTQANSVTSLVTSAYAQANTNAGVDVTQNTNISLTQSFANGAFTQANAVANYANGAFGLANTNATNITSIQGVNSTQNTSISLVGDFANGAFTQANTAYNIGGLLVGQFANGAFSKANNASDFANGAFAQANTAYNIGGLLVGQFANGAFATANSAGSFANGAFAQANSEPIGTSAGNFANGAFALANTNSNNITTIQGVDAWQNTYSQLVYAAANNAGDFANGAFAQANTNANNIITVQGVNDWQNTYAQLVYAAANNAGIFANGAFTQANTAVSSVSAAYAQSNTAYSYAISSFQKANSIISPTYTTSSTPPSNPSTSAIWYNTTTDILYQWITTDGTNYYWVDIESPTVSVGNTTISYTYTGYGRSAAMAMIFGGF